MPSAALQCIFEVSHNHSSGLAKQTSGEVPCVLGKPWNEGEEGSPSRGDDGDGISIRGDKLANGIAATIFHVEPACKLSLPVINPGGNSQI